MTALLTAAWSRAEGWIAAIGAALAVLAAIYGAGRRDGRALAEARTQQRAARARELRDAVDRDVDRTGDPADELRRDWRRE
jgi:F0F1-type ATP synthase membrane subunit c/vacuolar-type H+-ATPase subunit K